MPLVPGAGPSGSWRSSGAGSCRAPRRRRGRRAGPARGSGVENARLTLRQHHFAEELAEKVAAATARLRELDQAKSEFLSVVSHELRTPLTALQGFTELLLRSALSPERARRCLVTSTPRRHARTHRGELLDLSRIEAGRPLELKPELIDLAGLIERNLEIFAAEPSRAPFPLDRAADPTWPCARIRDALDRMVKNLLSNAVKYSPRGGPVYVSAGPAEDQPGMIELAVEDDGVGIPAEQLPRIFDKYVRVAAIPTPPRPAAWGWG